MPNTIREHTVGNVIRRAVFSPCEAYRYRLSIQWSEALPMMTVIGLNPSTATEKKDDNTVSRCCTFAREYGHGGLHMLNLFAYRATDPKAMMNVANPVGPDNDAVLMNVSGTVVLAWGNHGAHMGRSQYILDRFANLRQCPGLWSWGVTKLGEPKHPLYLPANAVLIPWSTSTE